MNSIYISIGAQCTTSILFEKIDIKAESLPFDWMFSTPEFVYIILKLLLIDNVDINDIIDNHFFVCDNKAIMTNAEHHILDNNGYVLVNSKYNVCFPHDSLNDRDKYVRRMIRLKNLILDKNNFINFIYISVSSQTSGNYTLNGISPIKDIYYYIEKINDLLKTIISNYKISVFNTDKIHNISNDILHVKYYNIQEQSNWYLLLPELVDTSMLIINN